MTPHLRSRQVISRHSFRVLPAIALWSLGFFLPAPLLAGPVPADKPATFPAWWFQRDVIQRINPAVSAPLWANGDYPASDDFAAANQGQVKAIVTAAVQELNSRLTNVPDPTSPTGVSNGAGQALDNLVSQWGAAPAAGVKREDFTAANIGQLKTVSSLIYDRLISAGYYDQIPWAYNPGGANDFATVNLGQLKQLFRFDVSVAPTLLHAVNNDLWTGINGTAISSIPLTTPPGSTSPITNGLESQYAGDNYAERIRGYLTVPVSGIYRFWLTASDSAELYISNDDDPVNCFLRAEVKSSTPYRGWTDASAGKSPLLRLEKGRRYYIEVRHKAGTGADHVTVGWLKPSNPVNPDPASVTVPTEVVPASALSLRTSGLPPAFTPPSPLTWTDPESSSSPESRQNRNAAARFLIQATYGPSGWATDATYGANGGWTNATLAGPDDIPYDIVQVQTNGFEGWIKYQMDEIPQSKLYDYVQAKHNPSDPNSNQYWHDLFYASWWRTAVTGRDQLRQRVAFALSEIMVVSATALNPRSDACSKYYDEALAANAFGDFRQILKAVTLQPAMGLYLNMLRNNKPDLTTGLVPNENYARELMQLFSIGMNRLNPDGTLLLNAAGQPIPTYDQKVVEGVAHTFTGWDFDYDLTYNPNRWYPWYDTVSHTYPEWIKPMVKVPSRHFTGQKNVLNNVVLPGMATYNNQPLDPYGNHAAISGLYSDATYNALPDVELDAVLDAIFNHPNCGPFICRQLIQRLVTSDPSPAYVYRVVSKFNDDETSEHKRGSMRAVVKAILLDPEARSASMLNDPGFGKQREPLSRIAAFARAFPSLEYTNLTPAWANNWGVGQTSFTREVWQIDLNQTPLGAPSVFNFFRPDYQFPGVLAQAGLTTPEFQLTNETSAINQANAVHLALFNWSDVPGQPGLVSFVTGNRSICLDLRPWMPLTDNGNLSDLIDKLNIRLMAGQLPSSGPNTYRPANQRSIVNAKQAILDFVSSKTITGISAAGPGPVTITVAAPHGLVDGERVFFSSDIGGSFSQTLYEGYPRKDHVVTVTGPNTFTIPVQRTSDTPVNLTGVTISHLPYDRPFERIAEIVNLIVNSPDFIIQR